MEAGVIQGGCDDFMAQGASNTFQNDGENQSFGPLHYCLLKALGPGP